MPFSGKFKILFCVRKTARYDRRNTDLKVRQLLRRITFMSVSSVARMIQGKGRICVRKDECRTLHHTRRGSSRDFSCVKWLHPTIFSETTRSHPPAATEIAARFYTNRLSGK